MYNIHFVAICMVMTTSMHHYTLYLCVVTTTSKHHYTLYLCGYDICYAPLPTRTLLNPHCSLTSCIRGSTANSRVVRPQVFRIKRDFVTNMLLSLKNTRIRHEHRCSTILGDN